MSGELTTYDDNTLMPFGMHTGTALVNVPASYLLWLNTQTHQDMFLKEYITNNMDVLTLQAQKEKNDYYNKMR